MKVILLGDIKGVGSPPGNAKEVADCTPLGEEEDWLLSFSK